MPAQMPPPPIYPTSVNQDYVPTGFEALNTSNVNGLLIYMAETGTLWFNFIYVSQIARFDAILWLINFVMLLGMVRSKIRKWTGASEKSKNGE